jgi:SAM-dependent methyltransferase
MAIEVDGLDTELLESEIKRTYTTVATEPDQDFMFPTGRAWAADLGYPADLLARVPETASASFAGAGTDSLVAAQMVGPAGRVVGVDYTVAMVAAARVAAGEAGLANATFVEGVAEALPFEDASFDVAISNGAFDLLPDKDVAFADVFRVLRPGGRLQFADVTIQRPVSEESRRATSTSGPVELPVPCWRQGTHAGSSATASSGSRPEISSTPTPARSSRTRAARPRSSARAARPSRPASRKTGRHGQRAWAR